MEALITWIQFFSLTIAIGAAGYFLSIHADQIAEKTGLGGNIVGIIMLGTITSLPELMTGVSSVAITDNPDLAIGDVLGSCAFNLTLVFFLDIIHREGSIYNKATQGQILTGALGMIMIAFAGFSLAVTPVIKIPSFAGVGIYSFIIPVLYIVAMKLTFDFEKKHSSTEKLKDDTRPEIKKHVIIFSIAAVVIILCGVALPFVGEKIMHVMGWESAFVGTIFMALATSLPEMAVTISALRINAVQMAFSNLLGSNLFNIVMLAVDDFAYRKGPLLEAADPSHLATIFSTLMMTGVVMLALMAPPQKRIWKTASMISFVILLLYIINGYVIYHS